MIKERGVKIREGNISLILDNYSDLFSDFDPRPFSERALSDDFLQECKRASLDKEDRLELNFLIPKKYRDFGHESLIKRRLKNYFQKHSQEKQKKVRAIKREGLIWFAIGALVMFGATFLYDRPQFFYKFLLIIAEPAGWFMFWEGLIKVFMDAKEKKPEADFYTKMADAKVSFSAY
jgi:hypothetical protein